MHTPAFQPAVASHPAAASALQANKRIDGLYLYVSTSIQEGLQQRLQQRLTEAEPSIARRLAWATAQVARATVTSKELFHHVIDNTEDEEVGGWDWAGAGSALNRSVATVFTGWRVHDLC
jgi:hypothetical protein